MNRNQAIMLIVAIANLTAIILFPPFDSIALSRTAVSIFDAFYPLFAIPSGKLVNSGMLYLEVMLVLVNAAAGWILLGDGMARSGIGCRKALLTGIAINMALMLLFPPFENFPSTLRVSVTSFDGFYFYFGDKFQRNIYQPILFLEIFLILINGAILWLLLREKRGMPAQKLGARESRRSAHAKQ